MTEMEGTDEERSPCHVKKIQRTCPRDLAAVRSSTLPAKEWLQTIIVHVQGYALPRLEILYLCLSCTVPMAMSDHLRPRG